MPATLTYPGVYIEEIPSGVRTITGVATSITAFIGRAARGPVNEAVTINSFGDFERTFGGLQEQFLMSYAVRDFYYNGGSQAIIVRLIHPNFATDADFGDSLVAATTVVEAASHAGSVAEVQAAADNQNTSIKNGSASQQVKDAAQAIADAVDTAAGVAGAKVHDVNVAAMAALAAAKAVAEAATGAVSVADAKTAADNANANIQSSTASAGTKLAAQKIADAVDTAAGVAGATVHDVKAAAMAALAAAKAVADAATGAVSAADAKTAADNANAGIQSSGTASPAAKTAANAVAAAIDNAVAAGATLSDVKTAIASAFTAAQTVANAATNKALVAGATVNNVKTAADETNAAIQSSYSSQQVNDAAQAIADAVDTAAGVAGATVNDVNAAATAALAAAKAVADAASGAGSAADAKTAADNANASVQSSTASAGTKAAAQKIANAVSVAAAAGPTLAEVIAVAKAAFGDAVPTSAQLQLPTSGADFLVLEAANEGSWGNALRARVDYEGLDPVQVGNRYAPLTGDDLFNLSICDMNTGVTEQFLSVSVKDSPRRVDRVLETGSNLVGVTDTLPASRPTETDAGLSDQDKKVIPFSANDSKRSVGVAADYMAGDGGNLDQNDITEGDGLQDNKRGLYALDKADLFNLLCIPPDVRTEDETDAIAAQRNTVYGSALNYCVGRRAMLIVDPHAAWSANSETAAAQAKAGLQGQPGVPGVPSLNLTGEAARNAALYFPRVIEADPQRDGQLDTFVPCGIVAGIMARTDTNRGVWKAPAGLDASLSNVSALEVNLSDAENGMLNPLGINCLRFFQVSGRVVWGARTLRGADQLADDYKYLSVRRLALYIEESLYRGTQWILFEPNDEPLWAQIRLNIGAFMHGLFRQRAFQGQTPTDAYFVKCDKETTPQDQVNLGIVNIIVGFAPLKPAEFVVIQIQQMAGQIAT